MSEKPLEQWEQELVDATRTARMSRHTADVLMGGPTSAVNDFDHDLYELRKLADRVLAAVAAAGAQELAFREAKKLLPCDVPELEFSLPMPSWEDA